MIFLTKICIFNYFFYSFGEVETIEQVDVDDTLMKKVKERDPTPVVRK